MARIKVTGYIESDDLDFEDVDLSHEMGVSSEGYEAFVSGAKNLPPMDDLEFTLET